MARVKRGSIVLDLARQRLAGLKSLTTAPDFGAGLTLDEYEQEINGFAADLDAYNQGVAVLDDKQIKLDARQIHLRQLNRRMLSATEAKFGPNSSEFEQAGGKRQSEHKRRRSQAAKNGPPTTQPVSA